MREQIPDDILRFILTSVPSVPYLEALLLLRSAETQAWDAMGLARRLYIPQQKAEELLRQLAESGCVAMEPEGARWRPPQELATLVDELAHLYSEDLLGVTAMIHSRQDHRARQFADAFRLRKKEE
jgi:DNA-binding IclR family transcriptional regulator